MRRRYCSRCLQTFGSSDDPERCTRPTCRRHRPPDGWPAFLAYADIVADRYEVQEILGAGGAGITYRCLDQRTEDLVAVKILHADRSGGVLAHRLAIEGEVLELLHHEHIVPFRALNLVGPTVYLVTTWMPGGSLDGWIRRHGTLSPKGTRELGRQLGLALDYVHAGGIVHRDLKPGNVLLEVADTDAPVVRLGDFGIARMFREASPVPGLTRTGAFIGTPEYAAPEQRRGERTVGPAADSFALGALLHYAACGSALHRREEILDWEAFRSRAWDPAERPRLTQLVEPNDELAHLDEVIDALMHPDPRLRLDMATAALRLGADPHALAPHDSLTFSPPSLISSAEHDLDAIDLVAAAGFDALVPGDDDEPVGDNALLAPLKRGPSIDPAEAATLMAGLSPAASREPAVPIGAGAPASPSGPALSLPPPGLITRNASEDWEYEDLEWPPAHVKRNRRHGRLLLLLAFVAGVALAYPGGPAALPGADRLAALNETAGALVAKLSLPAPTTTLKPPPVKQPVLPTKESRPAKAKPAKATVAKATVAKATVAKATVAKATKPAPKAKPSRRKADAVSRPRVLRAEALPKAAPAPAVVPTVKAPARPKAITPPAASAGPSANPLAEPARAADEPEPETAPTPTPAPDEDREPDGLAAQPDRTEHIDRIAELAGRSAPTARSPERRAPERRAPAAGPNGRALPAHEAPASAQPGAPSGQSLAVPGTEPSGSDRMAADRQRFEQMQRLRRIQAEAEARAARYEAEARRQHARASEQMERWTESQRRAREIRDADPDDEAVADGEPGVGIPPRGDYGD